MTNATQQVQLLETEHATNTHMRVRSPQLVGSAVTVFRRNHVCLVERHSEIPSIEKELSARRQQ